MNCDYQDFEIEPFELGRGLWHAKFGRADKQPVVIDGVMFSTLNVGLAWPNPDAAVDDAKAAIDRLTKNISCFGPPSGSSIIQLFKASILTRRSQDELLCAFSVCRMAARPGCCPPPIIIVEVQRERRKHRA